MEVEREQTCCFTGHRSSKLPWHTNEGDIRCVELKRKLREALREEYEGGIIDEKEFMEKLPHVAELAVGDACTGSNPRKITPAQMAELLKSCYFDKETVKK